MPAVTNKSLIIAAVFCLVAPLTALPGSTDKQCNSPLTVIDSVRVFDGLDVKSEATVILRCSEIVHVLYAPNDYPVPEDAVVIDGQGKTLLPGLIDAHVHVWRRSQLERSLDFGVTTVFDMGSSRELTLQMRDEEVRGVNHDRADLRSAVLWVTAPDSHGTQFGEVPTLSEPGEAPDFVTQRVADGADYIKVIYDHFKMIPRDVPTLSRETMIATVAAANQQGRMAVFHSRDVEAVNHAVEAGASGFVHVPVDEVPGEALVNRMQEKGVFVTPNLSLARNESSRIMDDPDFGPMLTESEIEGFGNWRPLRNEGGDEVEYETLITLHRAGVPILAGSDMPNGGTMAGATVHAELELMVEAGMTPVEALRAATWNPASAYGFEDRGRIAPGMLADLVLVEGKPDEDIIDTRRIVTIWKSGVIHDPGNQNE